MEMIGRMVLDRKNGAHAIFFVLQCRLHSEKYIRLTNMVLPSYPRSYLAILASGIASKKAVRENATKLALALLGEPMACIAMFALRLRSLDGRSPHIGVGPHMTFELWTSITRQEVDTKKLLHVLDSDASPQDADDLVRFAVALLCAVL